MTHSGGKPHAVGDEGQRFEVTYYDPADDTRKIYGWTDNNDAACQMGNAIDRHPSWCWPHVTDRHVSA